MNRVWSHRCQTPYDSLSHFWLDDTLWLSNHRLHCWINTSSNCSSCSLCCPCRPIPAIQSSSVGSWACQSGLSQRSNAHPPTKEKQQHLPRTGTGTRTRTTSTATTTTATTTTTTTTTATTTTTTTTTSYVGVQSPNNDPSSAGKMSEVSLGSRKMYLSSSTRGETLLLIVTPSFPWFQFTFAWHVQTPSYCIGLKLQTFKSKATIQSTNLTVIQFYSSNFKHQTIFKSFFHVKLKWFV